MCRGCNKYHNVCWFYRVTFLSCCYSVTMLDNFSTRNKEEEVKKNLDVDIFSPKIPNIKFINFWIFGDFSLSFFSRNSKLSKLSSISITPHNRFIRPKNRKKVCIWDKIQDELQTKYIHTFHITWMAYMVLYCSSLLDYMLGEKCPCMLYCYTQCIFSVACPVFWSKKM